MGACSFFNVGKGASAQAVFHQLGSDDRYENGHSYSGGIGMKDSFKMVSPPPGVGPLEFAGGLLEKEGFWQDKRDAAACVDLKDGRFAFVGLASS